MRLSMSIQRPDPPCRGDRARRRRLRRV